MEALSDSALELLPTAALVWQLIDNVSATARHDHGGAGGASGDDTPRRPRFVARRDGRALNPNTSRVGLHRHTAIDHADAQGP
jgi:hypothetical protein